MQCIYSYLTWNFFIYSFPMFIAKLYYVTFCGCPLIRYWIEKLFDASFKDKKIRNFQFISTMKTSTKGISSIKPEMGILIIYSYSVIDVRTWWFGWVQEIQEAIFKREHSSSALLLICNKHSWDTITAKIKSYKA